MTARLAPGIDLSLSGALILGIFALAASTDFYGLRLLTVAGAYALMVIGYQFVFGLAGSLSLAQGAFFGLGAYVAGILGTRYGLDFAIAMPLAMLVPALLALVVAAPVLRLESHYFALATLGIAQVILLTAINWETLTGGANGLPGVPPVIVFGQEVPSGMPMLTLVWLLVAVGVTAFFLAARGTRGLAFWMLREEPLAAASIGLDGGMHRLAALLASAALGGIGGAVYVHTSRVISPEALEFPIMVACLSMAVIGGRATASGAIIGAVLLVHLPEWFRFLEGWYLAAYGAGLLAAIVAAPEGIVGPVARLFRRRSPLPAAAAPPPAPHRSRTSGAEPVLELDALVKRFGGITAVDQVSFTLRPGEILGLIGPNGSGKTTLANIVSGFERADAGSLRSRGTDLDRLPAHRRARLGFARTFQAGHLVPGMTVLEAVAVARGGTHAEALAAAHALLAELDISEHADRPCGEIPQGVRRMVEVARALALRPRAIILDEPAAGLAGPDLELLSARLRAIAEAGTALLLIEHNMSFLLPIADRLACLDEGRLIALGDVETVRRDPEVLRVYLGGRKHGGRHE